MAITALTEVRDLLGGEKFPQCESPSLRLEKFVRLGGNTKKDEIDAVVACQKKCGKAPSPTSRPTGAVQFPAKLQSRLIVNQAGGVLENAGPCLHPHFGYPYIPGSAVKGVARHAAWCEWNEAGESRKEGIARKMARVFGYPTGDKGLDDYLKNLKCDTKRGGCVSFWPAVPDGRAPLVTDIVNCHHMKYYGGNQPYATDDESPNPQFFPAVESGVSFLFTLVPLRDAGAEDLGLAKKWLVKAIMENGVGAKTSAGYGWFAYSQEDEKAYLEKIRLAHEQEEKARRKALEEAEAAKKAEAQRLERVRKEALPPEERILEDWRPLSPKAIANGRWFRGFDGLSKADKLAIVAVLRTEGVGREVWAFLKKEEQNPKRKIKHAPAVVGALRKLVKEEKLEKLP